MKGSKWTFLRDKCLALEYIKAAEVAQKIEDTLYNVYSATNTEAWKELTEDEVEDEFSSDPDTIIDSCRYCRGCEEKKKHNDTCSECKFGKYGGMCCNGDSLFTLFCTIFSMEEKQAQRRGGNEGNETK